MVKLANPLYYPLSVLVGGIVLVTGIRLIGLPNIVVLPTAIVVTTAGAAFLKSREPDAEKLAQQNLQRELQMLQATGKTLAEKAEALRQQANLLLSDDSLKLELLVVVQQACDRAIELPAKIDLLSQRIQNNRSLLSVQDLQQQLLEVQNKLSSSSGMARQNLEQLASSLERNIQLARAGEDTRQAQIVNLYTSIQDAAGVLQLLQNRLRTANFSNSEEISELRALSTDLNSYQENVELLVNQ